MQIQHCHLLVLTHKLHQLLHIARNVMRWFVLFLGLFSNLLDCQLRTQPIPHDNSSQMFFALQPLFNRQQFLPRMIVMASNLLQPHLASLIVSINLFAETFIIQIYGLHDFLLLNHHPPPQSRMQIIALSQLAYLHHLSRTIYWYTYYRRSNCCPIIPWTIAVSYSMAQRSIGDRLLLC